MTAKPAFKKMDALREQIASLGIGEQETNRLVALIVDSKEQARLAKLEEAAARSFKTYAHVTVIIDDGAESIIFDIPKMDKFLFDVTLEAQDSIFPSNFFAPQRIESMSFSGKPLPLRDGTMYTKVRRAKDDE